MSQELRGCGRVSTTHWHRHASHVQSPIHSLNTYLLGATCVGHAANTGETAVRKTGMTPPRVGSRFSGGG